MRNKKRLAAASFCAMLLAVVMMASAGDDILRAVCAGLGPDHPLYDILGCPAVMNPPSPEG